MFAILRAFGKRNQADATLATPVRDPWEGSSGFYVASLRIYLDDIADRLSRSGCAARTRFNPRKSCAEIHTPVGGVLAQVQAHGDMACFPYKAVVTLSVLLPEAMKKLFAASRFGSCRVEVKESQGLL